MEVQNAFVGWSHDDIVFLNRNQAYGAFQLRKDQDRNAYLGLLGTVALVLLAVAVCASDFSLLYRVAAPPEVLTVVTVKDLNVPKPKIEIPIPNKATPPPANTIKHLEMVAKIDIKVDDIVIPQNADVKESKVGVETQKGELNSPVFETVPSPTQPEVKLSTGVLTVAEFMPEYPEGEEALMRDVSSNIHYPSMEEKNGIQGKLVVGFVVNEDGGISDIKILKHLSAGIDREAMRVVSLLRRFKPGMQQGRAVKVSYTLPILFQIAGE